MLAKGPGMHTERLIQWKWTSSQEKGSLGFEGHFYVSQLTVVIVGDTLFGSFNTFDRIWAIKSELVWIKAQVKLELIWITIFIH